MITFMEACLIILLALNGFEAAILLLSCIILLDKRSAWHRTIDLLELVKAQLESLKHEHTVVTEQNRPQIAATKKMVEAMEPVVSEMSKVVDQMRTTDSPAPGTMNVKDKPSG